MIVYPHNAPIILTDSIFISYGGHIGNSQPVQRQAAFLIAEMAATTDLDTFLLPTTVTGSYTFHPSMHRFMLDYGYVNRVFVTRFLDEQNAVYWTQSGTNNVYVHLWSDTYGVLDVDYMMGSCHCQSAAHLYPYTIQVMYEAGLPTGTASKPDILLGLTTYADLLLQEIIGYGNEAPGDIGVQRFSNQDYSESRVALLRTVYGTSARAQFAHNLFTKYRHNRYVGM